MRGLSFGVGATARLSAPEADRRDTYAPVTSGRRLRRRLTDTIEGAFEAALQQGDLATAEELLNVLENMQARASISFRSDRRTRDRRLERVRRELENRKLARNRRL